MAWNIKFDAGVYLPQLDWWLDAHFPVNRSFVSHAHSDHTATHREILCSAGTARLMRARLPGERIEHVLPFNQTEQLTPDCTVTLHPAGHIFGSAQSLLHHADFGRLLYTGDFKLRRGLSAEACATPETDVLIMETTFGRPHYVFPPTQNVLSDIAHFCQETLADGKTPVLFGYSLGKSQELLSGLTAANLPVMLHPQTFKLTRIYEEFGIRFPPYRAFSYDEIAGHVVICPPQSRDSFFVRKIAQRRTAVITGWATDPNAIYRYQCDAAFPLSDHADFPDLLRFVEAVRPKRVLTLHGFAQEFAQTLRDKGIEAWAVGQDNQLELEIAATPRRASAGAPAFSGDATSSSHFGDVSSTAHDAEVLTPSSIHSPDGVSASVATGSTELASDPSLPSDSFARFAQVAQSVKATPKKLEKIALLQSYLAELSPDDAAHAAIFFTGRSFPQTDQRNLNLGWAVIKRAVLAAAGVTEADLYAAYRRYADTGDATAAVLTESNLRSSTPLVSSPTLSEIAAFFSQAAEARGPAAKLELLSAMLATLSPDEARYLVKIITGDLRIGLKEGLLEEAVAAAAGEELDAVREANMLSGAIAAACAPRS